MTVKTIEIRGANAYKSFSKTRVGCRGIVIRDSRMLISHELNSGYELIPGGGLEGDETPEECCVREIREETGVLVKPCCHFLTIYEYYEEYRFISHYFVCQVVGTAEQSLTEAEQERGLMPVWKDPEQMLALYAGHRDLTAAEEEKRGAYLREYTALTEYMKQFQA